MKAGKSERKKGRGLKRLGEWEGRRERMVRVGGSGGRGW